MPDAFNPPPDPDNPYPLPAPPLRNAQRAQLRAATSCPVPVPAAETAMSHVRPAVPCEPAPAAIPPDKTFAPAAPAPAAPPSVTPPVLSIGNDTVSLTCAQVSNVGPVGTPITIQADQIENVFSWLDVTGITQDQLSYISTLRSTDVLNYLLSQTAAVAAGFFHLPLALTTRAQQLAQAIKVNVNLQATTIAHAAIDCSWVNTQQSISCGPGSLITAQQNLTTSRVWNPSAILQGTYPSKVSQSHADQAALNAAISALSCVYGNLPVTVSCSDLGFTATIPTDAHPWPYLQRGRIGSVTIPANTYFSSISQTDATSQAKAAALTKLACFFINDAMSVSCDMLGKLGVSTASPGNIATSTPGNPISVPQGFVADVVSQAKANQTAISLAEGFLSCVWGNAAITLRCQPRTITDPLNPDKQITVQPSSKSPALSITVTANTIISNTSQADADAQALTLAQAQLQCLYCNSATAPRCVPPDISAGVANGSIPLPVSLSLVTSAWSPDATLGVPANVYCDVDPVLAQLLADSGIEPPISVAQPAPECRYGNDAQTGQCTNGSKNLNSSTDGSVSVTINTFMVGPSEVPASFESNLSNDIRAKNYANAQAQALIASMLNCQFVNTGGNYTCSRNMGLAGVSAESLGLDAHPIVIPAGIFISPVSQEDAQRQQDIAGLSQLNCFYLSAPIRVLCGDNPGSQITVESDGTIIYGTGAMTPKDGSAGGPVPVAPSSIGAIASPVIIPAGAAQSVLSQEDANQKAAATGLTILNCFWSNVPVIALCNSPDAMPWTDGNNTGNAVTVGTGRDPAGFPSIYKPGKPGNPITVTANAAQSQISPKAATSQAYIIAMASLNCCWVNQLITAGCAPSDGSNVEIPSSFAVLSATVQPNQVTDCRGTAAANAIAERMAFSMLLCSWTNAPVNNTKGCPDGSAPDGATSLPPQMFHASTGSLQPTADAQNLVNSMGVCGATDGKPGNDGAQQNCQGQCYGYYAS